MELTNLLLLILSVFVLVSSKKTEENTVKVSLSLSLESGFYYSDSISLEISSDPDAEIYYTIDGSIPTKNSLKYENAITLTNRSEEDNDLSAKKGVSPYEYSLMNNYPVVEKVKKGNVIRAIAILPDGNTSDIVSGTYFVGIDRKEDLGNLPIFSIMTDPDNLFDYEKGIYTLGKVFDEWHKEWCAEHPDPAPGEDKGFDMNNFSEYVNRCSNILKFAAYKAKGNYNNKGKAAERPAFVEYFPKGSNVTGFGENLGIRIMGSATRSYYQKSFHLTFRENYGNKNLKYEVIPDNTRSDGKGNVKKYKSFNIRNGGNDCEYTKIRDRIIQDLIRNRDSMETQSQDLAIAFIDGEYWGIYSIVEDYSDHHISNNYDIDNKNVIIIKTNEVEAGEDSDIELFNKFIDYVNNTDLSVSSNYNEVKKIIDVESFAWYYATTVYVEGTDGIFQNNNWAMWRVREPQPSIKHADGKWRMMMYGIEYSTGIYGDKNFDIFSKDTFNALKNNVTNVNVGTLIFTSLAENNKFKNLFINALSDIYNIDFTDERVKNTIDPLYTTLRPLMKDQLDRFGPTSGRDDPEAYYDGQVQELNDWLIGRHANIMKLIADVYEFNDPVKVTIEANNYKKGGFVINNGWKVFNKKFNGEYFKENILYITAVPTSKKHPFEHWIIKNCKFADKNSNKNGKSYQETIGIYPSSKCNVRAHFS